MRTRPSFIIFFLVAVLFVFSSCDKCKDDPADLIAAQLENNKQIATAVVHASAMGLSESLKNIPDSIQGVRFIRTYIDSIRFYEDKSGYFYVYNFNCYNIAHATQKDLQGKNLYNYQDSRGNFVIRLLSAAAQNGGGFVEFYWIKPGDIGEKLKIGYVEAIPGTSYFIGSGVYVPE